MKKLSELPDEFQLVSREYGKVEVSEIKSEIINYNHDPSKDKWFIPITQYWHPNAQYMIESYIECEYDEMYEGWDERAQACFTESDYLAIQMILDKVFRKDPGVGEYYEFGDQVEIDIHPVKEGEPV